MNHTVCIEEIRGLPANDISEVILLVIIPVHLRLAVHGQLVVVILGVAHQAIPVVPSRRDKLHPCPRHWDPVLVQVLAGVEGRISLKELEVMSMWHCLEESEGLCSIAPHFHSIQMTTYKMDITIYLLLQVSHEGPLLRTVSPVLRGAVPGDGVVVGSRVVQVESGQDAGATRAADGRRHERLLEGGTLVDQK